MDVGTVIGKYKVVEHIGRGGMADVWSARDVNLNRMVAIKTIAHGLSQEVDPVGLFNREAQTIAQMEHPNILPIYDFGNHEGQLYIVMRYVSGGALDDQLNQGPVNLDESLRYGRAIADALDYAHRQKVIHLDLKPANVLLDSYRSPYLADFGLATKLNPEGKANNPGSGTLLYMPPEQLTAAVLDKRADIYSFGVMMFHILTGELPFGGTTPLALKQLQMEEDLPALEQINPDVPPIFTEILRQATAINPAHRPDSLGRIIDQLHDSLMTSSHVVVGLTSGRMMGDSGEGMMLGSNTLPIGEGMDLAVLEALDLYNRARNAWSGGNGRFLLGVTNFLLMNGYYIQAEAHGLELDINGRQMLLRGALEYDQEVEYWWGQLDDDNRRWVCLHALRSGNAPARVRALYRLETLPDSEKPQIPKLVAQALQIETNEEARLAGLLVLATRAKLYKRDTDYEIKTEYRGRLLTTITRLGVQATEAAEWQEVIYTPEIDLMIAETAFDYTMPKVAEFAARTVGRMRSTSAVRYIMNQRKLGRAKALRALALIRDESPTLPPVVDRQGRFYAWGANTLRRMTDQPMGLVYRYLLGALGAYLAMFVYIYDALFNVEGYTDLLLRNNWARVIAVSLLFSVVVGFVPVLAGEFSNRLRHFWSNIGRTLMSMVAGTAVATFSYWVWIWFFLEFTPETNVILLGGAGMALGYVLTALFNLRGVLAVPLTAFLTFLPILGTYTVGAWFADFWPFRGGDFTHALISFRDISDFSLSPPGRDVYTLGIPFVLLIALGGHFGRVVADIRALVAFLNRNRTVEEDDAPQVIVVPNVTQNIPEGLLEQPAPAVGRAGTGRSSTLGMTRPLHDLQEVAAVSSNTQPLDVPDATTGPIITEDDAVASLSTELDVQARHHQPMADSGIDHESVTDEVRHQQMPRVYNDTLPLTEQGKPEKPAPPQTEIDIAKGKDGVDVAKRRVSPFARVDDSDPGKTGAVKPRTSPFARISEDDPSKTGSVRPRISNQTELDINKGKQGADIAKPKSPFARVEGDDKTKTGGVKPRTSPFARVTEDDPSKTGKVRPKTLPTPDSPEEASETKELHEVSGEADNMTMLTAQDKAELPPVHPEEITVELPATQVITIPQDPDVDHDADLFDDFDAKTEMTTERRTKEMKEVGGDEPVNFTETRPLPEFSGDEADDDETQN